MFCKCAVDRACHVWRIVLGCSCVLACNCRVWLRVGATKVQFLQQFLHVSGDFPALQHELASRRPVGRGKTIHAAIEDGRLKGELVDPVCNQGTLPIAVGAREFKCNLAPLVANSLGDRFGAREVVEELLLMVIDQYFRRFVSPCNVEWLKLAATSAAKGEPNQDAVFESTRLMRNMIVFSVLGLTMS